ncbi:hypothetical protein CK220_11875 [Mesorhizobium sp. WSM3860]|nr:hypothetical protein CK220_11875 [Mesorhizobium sp. WSM3860]
MFVTEIGEKTGRKQAKTTERIFDDPGQSIILNDLNVSLEPLQSFGSADHGQDILSHRQDVLPAEADSARMGLRPVAGRERS